jgi:predicted ATPase/DNA-binding winged helix-turn-helix (wHTH) protein
MPAEPLTNEILRFEGFELDLLTRSLLRDRAAVALGSRAFDVLVALVQRRGRVVSKDELLHAAWRGRLVEEGNLAVQVNALRKVLGERAIATVPGQGYQWALDTRGSGPAGAAPAPPDASVLGANTALPTPELIGRDDELAWLQRALAGGGGLLVTLVGTAGVGKTSLGRALVARYERHESTQGGLGEQTAGVGPGRAACLVELAPILSELPGASPDPSAVASAALGALGGTGEGADEPLTQLERHLARRARKGTLPSLLLIDNAEHVPAAVRALVDAVRRAAPDLPLMVTSQTPLHLSGERLLRIEPLAAPSGDSLAQVQASPAAALLATRAQAADRRFAINAGNAGPVAEICRRLDGLPLALELAAARLPLLGAEGVLARLSERWRLLRSANPALEARHQALRTALDWSYELLPAFERRLLHRLAAFAGSFCADEAQRLCDDGEHDTWAVLDALGVLIEKSLVVHAAAVSPSPRFVLLESVRDYAREHPAAQAEAPILARRHAELFVALAETAPRGRLGHDSALAALERLAPAADNLRAAMRWCIDHDTALGLRLAAALYTYWRSQGHLAEGRAACAALLERSAQAASDSTRLAVMVCLGALALEQDDATTTQAMGLQVLHQAHLQGDRQREAHGHGLQAHAAIICNEAALARVHFDAALAIYRELREPVTIAETLNNLAQCWAAEGQTAPALPLLEAALPLVQGRDRWTEAAVRQSLGDLHLALGDPDEAAMHLHASLALRRQTAHVQQVVMALQSMALLELHRGRPEAARAHLLESVRACDSHGYGQLDALGLAATGAWALQRGLGEAGAKLLARGSAGLVGTPIGARPQVAQMLGLADALARAELGAERAAAFAAVGVTLGPAEVSALALALLADPPL